MRWLAKLVPVLDALGLAWEVILVDDWSCDSTWELIVDTCAKKNGIKGVSLSRNFGHQNAIFTGLHDATGEAVITMDGDLQHPAGQDTRPRRGVAARLQGGRCPPVRIQS